MNLPTRRVHDSARVRDFVEGAEDRAGHRAGQPEMDRVDRPKFASRSDGYMISITDIRLTISRLFPGLGFLVKEC